MGARKVFDVFSGFELSTITNETKTPPEQAVCRDGVVVQCNGKSSVATTSLASLRAILSLLLSPVLQKERVVAITQLPPRLAYLHHRHQPTVAHPGKIIDID